MNLIRGFLTLAFLVGLNVTAARATDRYVVEPGTIASGNDVLPYNTWTNAATNIQWAVDAAANTETVWVSNGVYVLTNQILVTNAITLRSTNGPDVTIINGNFVAGSAVTNRCLLMSNSAAFVHGLTFSNGAFITTVTAINGGRGGGGVLMYGGILSNCTVCNNQLFCQTNVTTYPDPEEGGGGIHVYTGQVTTCRISANTVTNFNGMKYGRGGGIASYGNNITIISNCVVSNNEVSGGGATAYPWGGGIYAKQTKVVSSTITGNRNTNSFGYGGGIGSENGTIDNCTIYLNKAGYGGGIHKQGGIITNCRISCNTCVAGRYTAAVILSTANESNYPVYMYNTTIFNHTSSVDVVKMMYTKFYILMKDCRVVSNTLTSSNAIGIVNLSGEGNSRGTNAQVINCDISANNGIGIWADCGSIRNCLIANNRHTNASPTVTDIRGAGITITPLSNISVSACTIVGNVDTTNGMVGSGIRFTGTNANFISVSSCLIYSNGIGGTDDVFDAGAPTNYNTLQYSCVGTNTGFTGTNILVANPQFKDFAGGNYRLGPGSPCINTGSNENWMTGAIDLDGRPRIRYGTVDMGAYERLSAGTIFGVH